MNILTKETDYAVQSLVYITKNNNELTSTKSINQALKISRPLLRKILQILQKQNIVESIKGNQGGFRLKKAPKNIFISDLITIFQGPINLTKCYLNKKDCPNKKICLLRSKLKKIEKIIHNEFHDTSIESLMNNI